MIMDIDVFIKNIANQFDETDISAFNKETRYKDLTEWSSLIALSIIAMIDEEYQVVLKGNEMKASVTIEDLYNIIISKL